MKQVAQNYKSGEIALLDVPVPACRPGGVLVRTDFSLISMGTEAMKIHESKLSLIGKARARPDQVRKVMNTMAQLGPVATYKKVMNRLDSYTPGREWARHRRVRDNAPGRVRAARSRH